MNSAAKQLISGIKGCEGPLVTKEGRIYVVGSDSGGIYEITSVDQKREVANTGGVPAGLQLHNDGSIWVADMAKGLFRISPDEKLSHEVASFEGKPIRGCNDLYFDTAGNLYFTAPAGSSVDSPVGEIYFRSKDGQVLKLADGFAFCNGLAVSADDSLLIVAETRTKRLHAFPILDPGVLGDRFLFATLHGDHRGGPDGIDFDIHGRLISTNWGGGHLELFAPDGRLEKRVALPFDKPSNIHFRGPGSSTLLITEHSNHALWEIPWDCAGQMQFGWL